MRSQLLTMYVLSVDLAAVGLFATLHPMLLRERWGLAVLLMALAAIVGLNLVRIAPLRTDFAPTHPVVLCALATVGPLAAVLVGLAGFLGGLAGRSHMPSPIRFAFNVGNVPASIAAASWGYLLAGGIVGGAIRVELWPLAIAAIVYYFVNTGLVAGAISLERGEPYFVTWRRSFLWSAPPYLTGLSLAVGLLLALEKIGPWGLALAIPPCWLLAAFYRTHKDNLEERQRRPEEKGRLNEELEQKVAERTRELQATVVRLEIANRKLLDAN